jgi:simple sugar transport system permease protein
MSHVPPQGFDGMSVALLANSHPVGIIFTSIFISYLKNSAETLQIVGYNRELASVIIASIIFMAALSKIVSILLDKGIFRRIFKRKAKEEKDLEVNDNV